MQKLYVETLIPDKEYSDLIDDYTLWYYNLEDEYECSADNGYLCKEDFLDSEDINNYDDAFKALQRIFSNDILLLK